ncbi:unnamed protein product [Ixodes pacificus]
MLGAKRCPAFLILSVTISSECSGGIFFRSQHQRQFDTSAPCSR